MMPLFLLLDVYFDIRFFAHFKAFVSAQKNVDIKMALTLIFFCVCVLTDELLHFVIGNIILQLYY